MDRGVYLLVLHLPVARSLDVGALGRIAFPAGWYVYVGSAQGPGGLDARLRRHLAPSKRLHWHVDYLRAAADWAGAWGAPLPREWECEWARRLVLWPGAEIPALGFGASDCRCASHLVHFQARPDGEMLRSLTGGAATRWEGA
ncbi:MAG: GIY-YIG nuclease family protein [Chloroflexi bacterium]|nr:GIY-YIG nuclease family protein [Chloroflexota bacterium]